MTLTFDALNNFAVSTVATAPSPANSGTSLVVAAGEGSKFPTPPFNAVVWPTGVQADDSNAEIIRVTNIATDTFTFTRTQESTSARSIVIGDQIADMITAKLFTDITSKLTSWLVRTTAGDLDYASSSSGAARLAIGAPFQGLRVNAAGTAPAWAGGLSIITDTTLGTDTATFDFTSIPATFAHLMLFLELRTDEASVDSDAYLLFNNDSGANYDYTAHDSSYASFTAQTKAFVLDPPGNSATAANASSAFVTIPNYAGTTWHKKWLSSGVFSEGTSSGAVGPRTVGGKWRSAAAINRITVVTNGSSKFKTGSRATLYGLSV